MDIHITRKGEQHGPYPEANAREMLAAGQLLPTDLAWHAGADGWKPLSEVLGAATQPPATPPPSPKPSGGGMPKRTMAGAAPAEEKPAEEKPEDSEPDDPDKISVTRKGEPIGPYSREKAKEYFASGQLLPTDWGWHDGMDDWKPINEVLGISVPTQTTAAAGKSGKGKKVAMIVGIVVLVSGLGAAGYFFLYPMLKGDSNGSGGEVTKELSAEEKKVVGAYEGEPGGFTYKIVFLENGLAETYLDGRKMDDGTKWSIVNGEIHIGALDDADVGNAIGVYRINKDRSITNVAMIRPNGRREDIRKVNQNPLKKIQ